MGTEETHDWLLRAGSTHNRIRRETQQGRTDRQVHRLRNAHVRGATVGHVQAV